MTETLGETGGMSEKMLEAEFRDFHSTVSPDERKEYLIARYNQISKGEATWVRRSGDLEDEGSVFDYYVEGKRVGFVDEEQDGECRIYELDEKGVPIPHDEITRSLGEAVGLLETIF